MPYAYLILNIAMQVIHKPEESLGKKQTAFT